MPHEQNAFLFHIWLAEEIAACGFDTVSGAISGFHIVSIFATAGGLEIRPSGLAVARPLWQGDRIMAREKPR